MEPRDFRTQIVQPNVDEFLVDYASMRRAYNAIAAVDALAAQIYVWAAAKNPGAVNGVRDDSHYRETLAQQDPDFGLFRDVAKAQKHARLTRGNPRVGTSRQVERRPVGWGEAAWDEGRWDGPPQVLVTTNTGDLRYVEALIQDALTMLDAEMARVGVP